MNSDRSYLKAVKAVMAMFADMSLSKKEVLDNLSALRDEIDILTDSLKR